VRLIAPSGFLVGRSIHRPEDAAAAGRSADYLMFGTVFETPSKPGRTPAGCAALAAAVRATPVPILAVGGVTERTAADVARSGAAGVAAIGLFTSGELPAVVARVVGAFDLPVTGS
jgi:thiamine-phosphate diphosphorylase